MIRLFVFGLAALVVLPSGGSEALTRTEQTWDEDQEFSQVIALTSDVPSGTAVFAIDASSPGTLGIFFNYTPSNEHAPLAAVYIPNQGAAVWFADLGANNWDLTSHTAYASVAGTDVHVPPSPTTSMRPEGRTGWEFRNVSAGRLVLMWGDQPGPVVVRGVGTQGVAATLLAETRDALSFAHYSFGRGVNAGAVLIQGAFVMAGGNLVWPAEPGRQLVAAAFYDRGDTVSWGALTVRAGSEQETYSLTADDSYITSCACFTRGSIALQSATDLELDATYVGEGRTVIYGIAAYVPTSALPSATWIRSQTTHYGRE